jgi:hypothetical protein
MGRLISAAALLALVACQHSGGSFCDISKPFRLSPAAVDAMTDAEVQAALEHNAKGQRLCGWKP